MPGGLLFTIPAPCSTLHLLGPFILVTRHHAVVDHHQAAPPFQKLFGIVPVLPLDLHAIGGINHQDIGLVQLGGRGEFH